MLLTGGREREREREEGGEEEGGERERGRQGGEEENEGRERGNKSAICNKHAYYDIIRIEPSWMSDAANI